MPFGPRRPFSAALSDRQVKNLRAAAVFAHEVEHPLNLSIDINWTRTWLADDPDGKVLDQTMEFSRKWLKGRGVVIFAYLEVRESSVGAAPKPNAHVLLHCPPNLLASFQHGFLNALSRTCRGIDEKAVEFRLIGGGNPTLKAVLGKLAYMSKGADRSTAARFGIRREPMGLNYGKRAAISQDLRPAARRRHAAARALQGLQLDTLQMAPSALVLNSSEPARERHAANANEAFAADASLVALQNVA